MLTGGFASFGRREERRERPEPLLGTARQVARRESVGEVLQTRRVAAGQEGIAALPKRDPLRGEAMGQPMMLIEAHARREGKVGADADKQAAPLAVKQVEVVLVDPPPRVLEMPPVVFANRNQDARRLARLQDDDDLIGVRPAEVPVNEVIAPLVRGRLDDRRAPVLRPSGDPVVVLPGDVREDGFADRVQLPVGVEEADHALGLLKGLNQAVQQDAVEAAIGEPDTILMMLVEGVHGRPPGVSNPAG